MMPPFDPRMMGPPPPGYPGAGGPPRGPPPGMMNEEIDLDAEPKDLRKVKGWDDLYRCNETGRVVYKVRFVSRLFCLVIEIFWFKTQILNSIFSLFFFGEFFSGIFFILKTRSIQRLI